MSSEIPKLARVNRVFVVFWSAVLACGFAWAGPVSVVIDSPADGGTAVLGQEVVVSSTANAEAGVSQVTLEINGVVIRSDTPSGWNATSCRMSQSWTPLTVGKVVLSVVAFDRHGKSSDRVSVWLHVVAGGAIDMAEELEQGAIKAATPYTDYVVDEITIAPDGMEFAHAACPAESIVVGGGFEVFSSMKIFLQRESSNGWGGGARNDFGFDRPLTVYAVCLHNAPNASANQEEVQVQVAPGTKGGVAANCPFGRIATGGGFYEETLGDLRVYNSSKADLFEGWQVWVDNPTSSTELFNTDAMCLKGPGGSTRQVSTSTSVPAYTSGFVNPACESGELVTAGGFLADDDLVVYSSSGPWPAGNGNDEWRVYGWNSNANFSRTLYGYAICATLGIFADGFESSNTSSWSATVP